MKKICNPDYEYHVFTSGSANPSSRDHKHRRLSEPGYRGKKLAAAEPLSEYEIRVLAKYKTEEVPSCQKN